MIFVITPLDIALSVLFGLMLLGWFYLLACTSIREGRCKHDGTVSETRACDAICDKCGKNLGFIGAWRERHPKGRES